MEYNLNDKAAAGICSKSDFLVTRVTFTQRKSVLAETGVRKEGGVFLEDSMCSGRRTVNRACTGTGCGSARCSCWCVCGGPSCRRNADPSILTEGQSVSENSYVCTEKKKIKNNRYLLKTSK